MTVCFFAIHAHSPKLLEVILGQRQVSNDGHSYSNAKILTLYNGACQVCSFDSEDMCRLKVRRLFSL